MANTLKIYSEFFGLDERPFTLLPDPDYLYWSDNHKRAFTMLEYGLLTHAPITLITGEIGSGKTTLIRELLRTMPFDMTVGLVSNAQGDRGELLHWVLMSLDQKFEHTSTYVQLFHQFQSFLIAEYAAGRRTIIIFDEAQNLSIEALEELRMYSNINADKDELLQLVLVGQPQLIDLVNRPQLVQFCQRIVAEFHLQNMTGPEVHEYVRHRMEVAGAKRQVFSTDACDQVYLASGGTPRIVNQICDFALVYAYSYGRKTVDGKIIERVVADRAKFGAGARSRSSQRQDG